MNIPNIIEAAPKSQEPEHVPFWIQNPGSPWYQCPKCGHHAMTTTRFCPDCGQRLRSVTDE